MAQIIKLTQKVSASSWRGLPEGSSDPADTLDLVHKGNGTPKVDDRAVAVQKLGAWFFVSSPARFAG